MISTISELLESHLYTIANQLNLQIVYKNIAATPNDEIYLKSNILPAITTCFDLDGESRIYKGVYQVSVVAPINTGKSRSQQIVESIIKHFQLNLELKKGTFSLYINSVPSAYPAITDKTTYTIPISMNYRADTI
ncbi:phage tail terminator-like protein [Gilliamella apis]|uniref:DUF3168 domain-containing protein n=1 Tax=Gilliamella apis TaxID=1970738 RepID=A0A2V4DVA3_9GAMM|nr:phage tail terminator-like protein [Gilliamella apis]PXY91419.1 hypothetical protein DKK78_03550 [Gilliamella apis]WLS93594.1 phage tail terminator-like protein [Gilliamella apis]